MIKDTDTIVAIATPSGRGGVGIVRVSGPLSQPVAEKILKCVPKIRYAGYLSFFDEQNEVIDEGIALFFKSPHSYTGEDVIEFQAHGGVIVLDRLIKTILKNEGVRIARAGEFTERAFLNNKIDLIQAESIADLIDASSEQAAKSAIRSLQGEFSKKVHHILDGLTTLRMYVEAAIDFPEEEIDFLQDAVIHESCNTIIATLSQTLAQASQGALLREGIHVVIAGKPNAGKSSLLNRLSGRESAIVTDIAGTTRDILREKIQLDGLPLDIIDTAGLRDSDDVIEQEGIKRALREIQNADIVLFIVDASTAESLDVNALWPHTLTPFPEHASVIVVNNKIDLLHQKPQVIERDGRIFIDLSVKKNEGIDLLIECLKKTAGFKTVSENTFIARRRHLDALQRAVNHVKEGEAQLNQARAGELLAEELRQAQLALSEITGEFVADDLLGKIFSSFCIGK